MAPGSTATQGQVLWTIDAHPTVLLYGEGSLYRPLSSGVSDGADVQLLETALRSLGYDDGGAMTVDDHFDSATKAAVEAWQTALGVTANGTVNISDVVFSPGAVRVIGAPADVGDIVTGATGILTVTGTDPVALVTAPEQGAGSVQVGQKVSISIGMQPPTPGTVAIVSRNATWSGTTDSVATVQVAVTFDQPDQVGTLVDGTAVTATVDVKSGAHDGVAVPIAALHADGDTASAVSLVTNLGTTREVQVHVGTSGDGYVEVSAPDLHEGDRVRLG
jgi:peptidoglycan hydrolase-like protein with peptidoglycan-binding domain